MSHNLVKASSEVDGMLAELTRAAMEREQCVKNLEAQLTQLEELEGQLQKRVQELESVPVPVAKHFAQLVELGEKRSAWRDYMLFGLGVVVSTVTTIALSAMGF